MKFSNALYTYPVLSNTGLRDDYVNESDFSIEVEKNLTGVNEVSLNIEVKLSDNNLSDLLKQGDAKLVCHLESPLSSFRHVDDIDVFDMSTEIKIDPTVMRGLLEITIFIVAGKQLDEFRSDSFSEFYEGVYKIDSGDVLAFAPTLEVEVEPDDMNAQSKKSIINIRGYDKREMSVDLTGDYIVILLPKSTYRGYKALSKKGSSHYKVSLMAVIMPALMEAIRNLMEDYEVDRLWAKVITAKLKNGGRGSDASHYDPLNHSQFLLNNPADEVFTPIMDSDEGDM